MSTKAKGESNGLFRVLLVDDHDLFRTGLRNLLEEQGVQIVGEAANGQDAIRVVRRASRTLSRHRAASWRSSCFLFVVNGWATARSAFVSSQSSRTAFCR